MAQIEVTLADEQRAALEELARIRNVPVAELVKKGIEEVLRSARGRRDPETIRRALEVVGKFNSGLGDLAERHDDYLAEAYEE
ncbi:MAG: CopG family transcriptional regulator [Planctomycetes bacterium]|nr:CopG family transcriptional regulator [Planctomycetota bacterium]